MNKVSNIFKPGFLRAAFRVGLVLCIVAVVVGMLAIPNSSALAAPTGQTIWLRANANNQYVSADQNLANTQLVANRSSAQAWELFTVVDAGSGRIALRASNGRYVAADIGLASYGPLVANRTAVSTWESFQWIDAGSGQVRLIAAANGRYVAADLNRSGYLVADRTAASTWETFTWGTGSTPPTTTPPTAPPPSGWRLVWSDEFNGPNVNTSNWNFQTGCSGWGNGEWENYTNGANVYFQNDSRVNSSVLVIEARNVGGGNCGYTSTRMNSAGKRSFQYGRMEARLAIPSGQGLWPAFWMMGNSGSWPACGEIDIMEHVNTETRTHGYIHWDNGGHVQYGGSVSNPSFTSYHVYAIEWDASQIRWYMDNNNFATANILNGINGTSEFHQPFYFLLNLAVGGAWPGYPNASTPFPARYYIDYVRAYQR